MNAINQMMRAANPVPDPATALADDDFEALLLVSQTRSGKMDVKETMRPVEPEAPRRRGWLIAAVAFAAVVVVVGAAALLLRPTGGAAPATTPPTTEAAAPTTTAAAMITDGEALAAMDAYFESYDSGDLEAMLGLFASDPQLSVGAAYGLDTFEQHITWDLAQGTTNTPSTCEVERMVRDKIKLVCDYEALQGGSAAIGADPTPIHLTVYIGRDGIGTIIEETGLPRFSFVKAPFMAWMEANHPDDASAADFQSWSTIEEAERNGLLRLRYGLEWATYLKAQGCSYPDLDC
jgi:hypothetical protein